MWLTAKHGAEKLGREFSIEISDIVIPEKCPIFDVPLVIRDIEEDQKRYKSKSEYPLNPKKLPNSASLDRIDSSKGYVKGNIWVISFKANRMKQDASPKELRQIADAVDKRLSEDVVPWQTI